MLKIDAMAAASLINSATMSALVAMLEQRGVISQNDSKQIYEAASRSLDRARIASPQMAEIYQAAIDLIDHELHLSR